MTTRKQRIILTQEQREEIINSKLSNKELTKIYNSNEKTISNIRTDAGRGLGNKGKTGSNNSKLTPEQKRMVLDKTESVPYLADKFGVSRECLYKIRKAVGITRAKKEVVVKSPPKKKKTINKAETTFERENKERAKAQKLAEDFKQTTEWKLQNGWAWKPGACRSMVLKFVG